MNLRTAIAAGALSLAVLTGCAGSPSSGAPQAAPTPTPVTETLHLVTTKTAAPVTETSTARVTVTVTKAASDSVCRTAAAAEYDMIKKMFDIMDLQNKAATAYSQGDDATGNLLEDQITAKVKTLNDGDAGTLAATCLKG